MLEANAGTGDDDDENVLRASGLPEVSAGLVTANDLSVNLSVP